MPFAHFHFSRRTKIFNMRLLLVAIAGEDIGYGHLSRCISLADCAKRQGLDSLFLLFGDAAALHRVEHAGYPCTMQSSPSLSGSAAEMAQSLSGTFDAVVVDLAHPLVFGNIDGIRQFLKRLRDHAPTLIVIDALGEQALAPRMPDMLADVLVAPYVGAVAEAGAPWRTLAGPEYAVLAPTYADLPTRVVREHADRVLVSCGGADPKGLTLLVLEGVEQISSELVIRIIIGPLFSSHLVCDLAARAAGSRHVIELIQAPEGLADHMLWSDLAVAASGLIKYELAASATPAVLMSIDRSHDVVNRPFARMGSARDLGVEPSPQSVAQAISELLGDRVTRSAMAAAGRRVVDGKGAERLITEIVKVCNVIK